MEKPAGSSGAAGAESPASAEPASSRRRAGGQKRKANTLSTSSSSSTPSKRLTRDKAAISHSPIHNGGPLTRARYSPNNLASSAPAAATGFKLEEKVALAASEAATVSAPEKELSKLEELKAAIEAEFEFIRSRDSNAHVVPNHCGWFSWTKIHPLEECSLLSFFNGKSQIRTPDTYMEIRNWIMKKFHQNPNVRIELKDLLELEVADVDAKQEVLEFLDYWGLINFHPFPQIESSADNDCDRAAKKELLLEQLFHFKTIRPSPPDFAKPNLSTPSMPSGFPESSIVEELVRPEGPSVEYHCNSCSADCSRKRYHCQKQADYDLCADCFNNGKFDSNMSSSDFILMEPAEASGVSGGKWTDQETLLLLEALELYKENWNEIAEHVATKTKAQCILHFVQMPIEDVFFDFDDDVVGTSGETTDPPATVDDSSVPKDGTETNEDKSGMEDDQTHPSTVEAPKPEDASEVKGHQETVKSDGAYEALIDEEKLKDTNRVKDAQLTDENIALKALREAFEGVGYLPTPENRLSFAELGNPVMALAAFLGKLVGSDLAAASACSSLKCLNSDSPGMQMAAQHCFLLEDPPDDRKEPTGLDSNAFEMAQDAPKDNQEGQAHKGDDSTSILDSQDLSNDHSNKKNEESAPEDKQQPDTSNDDFTEKVNSANEASNAVATEEVEPGKLKESSESELQKDSNNKSPKSECAPSSMKNTEGSFKAMHSQLTEVSKNADTVSDSLPSENNKTCQSVALVSVEEHSQPANASKDVDMVSDSHPLEKNEEPTKSNSVGDHSEPTEASKGVDMLSSLPSEAKEPQQPVAPDEVVEHGAATAEGQKDSKEIKDDHCIHKIKRAAVSALSAAAVKAKLLATQEEDQIRHLAASLIERQLHKLEMKLAFFNEMDHVIMTVREQLDRSRQKLYHERTQIIAARLGLPPSSSRAMPPTLPTNRIAMNFANTIPRPPMSMTSQRPPISRPVGTMPPTSSNTFVSTATAGNTVRPSGQDKLSSVVTK